MKANYLHYLLIISKNNIDNNHSLRVLDFLEESDFLSLHMVRITKHVTYHNQVYWILYIGPITSLGFGVYGNKKDV
jgi:hypothetical protein